MNTPYTPGPWIEHGNRILAPDSQSIVALPCRLNTTNDWEHLSAENAANAQLIAAAPELAEALQEMKRLVEVALSFDGDVFGIHHNDVMDAISNTDNALRKAGLLPATE